MSRLPIAILLVLLAAFPAAASASSSQSMTFEAPRELLDPVHARSHAAGDPRPSGSTACACSSTGRTTRPPRRSKRRPDFDATDPDAYPAGAWSRLDGLFDSAQARGITVQLTLTGPVPRWATKSKRDNVTQPEPEGVPGLRHRGRPPLRRPRRRVVDLERAQPPAVPAPAVREQEGQVAADLPQPLPRRPARPARLGQRRRHAAVRRDRAARDPARRRAAGLPARRAVPQPLLPPARPAARASRPAASPTTPTRRASARASARRTATT